MGFHLLRDEFYCCHRLCLIISSSLLKTSKLPKRKHTTQKDPKRTSPLVWSNSLESCLKVFRGTHAPLQQWPFLNAGAVGSCETVWVAIDFAWEMASLVAPHFFVQSSNEQNPKILFRYTLLTAQLNNPWN